MSDYGLFESDLDAERAPQRRAKTAARHLDAAITAVRSGFGRFLIGSTGIDEFEDRWHYSKADIRNTVEDHAFPNTGTMRRVKNAMKADWKLAHPYAVKTSDVDRSAPVVDVHENFHPSDDVLVPEGDFSGYLSDVDQGADGKVDRDFSEGGDSGSDRHARLAFDLGPGIDQNACSKCGTDIEGPVNGGFHDRGGNTECPQGGHHAMPNRNDERTFSGREPRDTYRRESAKMAAAIYTDFARANGLRVASFDTLDFYAAAGIDDGEYRILANLIQAACDCEEDCPDDDKDEDDSEDRGPRDEDSDDSDEDDSDESDDDSGEDESEAEDDDEPSDEGEDFDFGEGDPGPEEAEESGPPPSDEGSDEGYDFGEGDPGPEAFGDEGDVAGQDFTVPEEAPPLEPDVYDQIPPDDTQGDIPISPEVVDNILGLPPGTIEQLIVEELSQQGGAPDQGGIPPQLAVRRRANGVPDRKGPWSDVVYAQGDDYNDIADMGPEEMFNHLRQWDYGDDDNVRDEAPWGTNDRLHSFKDGDLEYVLSHDPSVGGAGLVRRPLNYHQARKKTACYPGCEKNEAHATKFHKDKGEKEARRRMAFGEDPSQDPTQAAAGADPAAAAGQGAMIPPPGSASVPPPPPAAPTENQPAEDALLDTAVQSVTQMIDQQTQQYQQIIDPLTQALQAIQFAQQVEQAEHPLDVTPPQGTVDVDPSAAPGGAESQEKEAFRRWADGPTSPPGVPTSPMTNPDLGALYNDSMGQGGPDNIGQMMSPGVSGGPGTGSGMGTVTESTPMNDHAGPTVTPRTIGGSHRQAAAIIAQRHHLSETGYGMLLTAMSRKSYEHVREALSMLPPEQRGPVADHIGQMFAADNNRFSQEKWMNSVMTAGRTASDYHDNANTFDRHDPPDPHDQRCEQCGGLGGRHAHYCDIGGDVAYRNSSRGRHPFQ